MPTNISTPTRISAAATPTVLHTSPAGGTTAIYLRIVAGADTTAGRIKIEVNKGSERTIHWVSVPLLTAVNAEYWSGNVSLGGLVLVSGNTIRATTPQAIDFDFWVYGIEG